VINGSLTSFLTLEELAEKRASFQLFAQLLDEQARPLSLLGRGQTEKLASLASKLATDSYQIQPSEAKLIATTLLSPVTPENQFVFEEIHAVLPDDHFLNEAVFVSVKTMPKTFWRIVTVMPDSAARQEAVELFNLFRVVTLITILAAMILVWLMFRHNLTQPLAHLARQLKESTTDKQRTSALIETANKGELGALAHSFNCRTDQLLQSIAEKHAAQKTAIEMQQYFQSLFEFAPDATIIVDDQGFIRMVNRKAEVLFGWSRAELEGQLVEVLISNEERAHHVSLRESFVKTPAARGIEGDTGNLKAVRKDSGIFPVEICLGPIETQGSLMIVEVVRDISDRLQLQQQLQQASKMEAIGQLTGGIAHDFNNFLTSILGYTRLAQKMCVVDPESRLANYLQIINQSGELARDLIVQMMAFSRRNGSTSVLLGPKNAVKEVEVLLRTSLPSTVNIRMDSLLETAPVYMNPVQFHQLLMNLCINARDAMQGPGDISIGVHEVSVQGMSCTSCGQGLSGSWVEVTVTDSGSGIQPELLTQIFNPFFTTKRVGEGSGMGLSTVHGIMHERQGHVVVDTLPGEGTKFRLLFPLGEKDAAEKPTIGGEEPLLISNKYGNILVVDDESFVADYLKEYLTDQGYKVQTYGSGREALLAFKADPEFFDLLITDYTMPGMTGVELAQHLHAISPEFPIILYTGFPEAVNEQQIKQLGIRCLLQKPVSESQLVSEIERHLSAPG